MLQHAALAGLRREVGSPLLPALARGVASWAKFNPSDMSAAKPAQVSNLGEGAAAAAAASQPAGRRRHCLPHLPALPRLQCMASGCAARRTWSSPTR